MEPEDSLPHSQKPGTYRIRSQIKPVNTHHSTSQKSFLILFLHLRLDRSSGLFPSRVLTKILYAPLLSPIRSTRSAHHISKRYIVITCYRVWLVPTSTKFLGAFLKLRKAAVSFVICLPIRTLVRPSVRIEQLGFSGTFDVWVLLSNLCQENSSFIKIWEE